MYTILPDKFFDYAPIIECVFDWVCRLSGSYTSMDRPLGFLIWKSDLEIIIFLMSIMSLWHLPWMKCIPRDI